MVKKIVKKTKYFSFDNLNKPRNKWWRFITKFLCKTLPIYCGAIITLPISPTIKIWTMFAGTVITGTISALSEFTTGPQDD
jgi:predicted phosphoadenosine phosphosulfate sulfurtransferase